MCRRSTCRVDVGMTKMSGQSTSTSTAAGFEVRPAPPRHGGRPPPRAPPRGPPIAPLNHPSPPRVACVRADAPHTSSPCAPPVRARRVLCSAEGGGGSPQTLRTQGGGGAVALGLERLPKPHPVHRHGPLAVAVCRVASLAGLSNPPPCGFFDEPSLHYPPPCKMEFVNEKARLQWCVWVSKEHPCPSLQAALPMLDLGSLWVYIP